MTQTKDRLASLSTLRGQLLLTIGAAISIVLLGIALTVRPALAAPSPNAPQAQAVEEEWEEEEWEEEWEETCEEEECKEEAWEEVEGEDDGGWTQVFDAETGEKLEGPTSSGECPLGTVKPKAIFERDRGKLRLVIHYTADSPTQVGIDFWLRGDRDATSGHRSTQRRLGETGVLSLGRHLDRKAQGKSVIVELKAPAAPSNCPSKVTKRLPLGNAVQAVSSGRLARAS